jgi:phenylpyruvate tautomerase PptA (4-oxalocrotonate tautomerase family)
MYQCFSEAGSVPESVRPQIAQEVTKIHCDATGAPASFVHVVFLELPPGVAYTAGKISPTSVINAKVRSGRTLDVRQKIVMDLSEMWGRLTGQSQHELVIALEEVESDTIMEEGLIMPNPGDEAEWLKRNHDHLAEVGAL